MHVAMLHKNNAVKIPQGDKRTTVLTESSLKKKNIAK